MANSGRENKSIVDIAGITNESPQKNIQMRLPVVGHCPRCGASIYGPKFVPADKKAVVEYSCLCRNYQETKPDKEGQQCL